MSDTPPPARRLTPEHRRRVILVVVVTQLVLALITGATVFAVWRHLDSNIQSGGDIPAMTGPAPTIPPKDHDQPQAPLNVLVLGTDTREGQGDSVDSEKGCGCSDTTILFHVSADRKSAYGVSFPRDALVKPVDCTKDRPYYGVGGVNTGLVEWNEAFSAGQAPCTAEQIQEDFGVKVDDYVVVDFNGFKSMVNAIGGVNVCIPKDLDDTKYEHIDFPKSPSYHLDGRLALLYVRLRHAYDPVTGDYALDGTDPGRIKRQQAFISAMINKVFSGSTLTNPAHLLKFANALTDSITTNRQIAHVTSLIHLAEQFKGIDLHHIKFVTLPSQNYGAGVYENRVQVLPAAYRLMKRVAGDESLGKFAQGATTAGKHHGKVSAQTRQDNTDVGVCS
jgi:LCP family protein required for cell wall assembly